MADQVLYSGVACITDLMVKEGLINLDFADVRAVMREMGKAMMGTGEASGEKRALRAAEAAISNPLIDDVSMRGAKGLLISITGGNDLTLYEVDEAATRIREEVDQEANIIVGATFDQSLEGIIRVSVVATGVDQAVAPRSATPQEARVAEVTQRIRAEVPRADARTQRTARLRRCYGGAPPQQPRAHASAAIQAQAAAAVAAALTAARRAQTTSPSVRSRRSRRCSLKPPAQEPAPNRRRRPRPSSRRSRNVRRRAPRMPRIDELPMPAQNQLRARERIEPAKIRWRSRACRCCSGWRRSASAARRAEEEPQQHPKPAPPRAPCRCPSGRVPLQRLPEAHPQEPVSEFAKRSPPLGLDLDRPPPSQRLDDQLDIPAFLRRQAN